MSISYKSRRMVSNYPGKEKVGFMATKANGKTIHTDELCRAIADKTTLSTADVKGVIEALVCELESSLEEGNQVHIGDMGTFGITLTSPTVEKPEELRANYVTVKSINYLPSTRIKERLRKATFTKAGK
ncbi:MAG: HU family DNA-binding protein [Porphyromonadaceae bacterium]|nr:HU family DNA-binding protein [uncultured Macellibacteroides sp.]MCE5224773.1 HU family DNA-binding protein [Porphyromonadaceae bacterium]